MQLIDLPGDPRDLARKVDLIPKHLPRFGVGA